MNPGQNISGQHASGQHTATRILLHIETLWDFSHTLYAPILLGTKWEQH